MRTPRAASALVPILLLHGSLASLAGAQTTTTELPEEVEPAAPPAEEGGDEEEMSDAEMEAEADRELAAEEAAAKAALTKPPAKGKGAIVGTVKDAVEHDTLPEAQITVVGTKIKTIADFDGRYRLELPPGTYTLRIYVELHKPSVIKGVEVKVGQIETFDIDVVPDEAAVETVEIVTEVDKSSVEGLLLTRQRSGSVGDGVGRAEIARTPASNAAQAAQRVVGATIVGNRFVYVRGLGERYTNSLLNGAPLPSPEPDRAAIPLDLFPSLILENITIVKTFTPDVPGDFAGGSVRIDTRELPSKPLFQLSAGLGYDTASTFQDRYTHPGSPTDWLGYDHSTRAFPEGFPSYVLRPGLPKPGRAQEECKDDPSACISNEEVLEAGRSINASMHPRSSFTAPNYSVSTVAGNGWALGKDQRLGVLGTFNYGRSFRVREAKRIDYQPAVDPTSGQDIIEPENTIDAKQGEDKVNWGSLGSVSYWLSRQHRLTLSGLHTQLADATTNVSVGDYENFQGTVRSAQLRYISRALNMVQLRGEHDFPSLNKASLTWNASYSVALRDEPDTRTTAYVFNDVTQSWSATTSNGVHEFSEQIEKQKGGGLDWTQPLTNNPDIAKLKVGGLLSTRDRDYKARRFLFKKANRGSDPTLFECGPTYELNCPEKLFQWGNLGTSLTPTETTFPDDAYTASLDVYAGYGMLDVTVWDDLRAIAGVRAEHTNQTIHPYSQFASDDVSPGAEIDQTDWLPALSLAYSATRKTKLRAAYSQTLARPQIRELSPSTYADYFGGRQLSGNTQLELTHIDNIDLRFEAFPTPREVLAFSTFYKLFDAPIEPYVTSNSIVTFQNAKAARLVGVELEGRKSLDFLGKALSDFSVIANLTLAYSQIELDENQGKGGFIVTNEDRPMVNQAPYVINVALDYENQAHALNLRLLYNQVGKRIIQVGTAGLDDEYEQPRPSIDATVSKGIGKYFQVRLNATNVLNRPILYTLGKRRSGGLETYRESEGRVFTLTGTYTY